MRQFGQSYRLHEQIGKGGYSSVHRCTDATGNVYACKTLPKDRTTLKRVLNEVSALRILSKTHPLPKVPVLVDALEDGSAYHIVQELCASSVQDHMIAAASTTSAAASEEGIASIIRGALRALVQVHAAGIIHNDVKSGNLLLAHPYSVKLAGLDATIKLADFGACVNMSQVQTSVHDPTLAIVDTLVGTPHFMAPETLRCTVCAKSDVWSIGVLTYQLLSGGSLPFTDATRRAEPNLHLVWRSILQDDVVFTGDAWEHVSADAKDFINGCLAKPYSHRPAAAECLEHPWVAVPLAVNNHERNTVLLNAWPLNLADVAYSCGE